MARKQSAAKPAAAITHRSLTPDSAFETGIFSGTDGVRRIFVAPVGARERGLQPFHCNDAAAARAIAARFVDLADAFEQTNALGDGGSPAAVDKLVSPRRSVKRNAS